ncbi:MAG TPA: hypothetical protein VMF06_14070 [Candidatus Limnocylindria bacterium]|jgi:hypothetical protein|nr:hypothetical protein [Candidatus Limnocylindria bacterium]
MKKITAFGSFLGLAVVLLWYANRDGESARVKRVVEEARSAVSWDGSETALQQIAAAGRLAGCLSKDVEVKVDVLGGLSGGLSGADEVKGAVLAARQHIPRLEVQFLDLTVSFTDPTHAKVELTANATTDKPKEINPQEFVLLLHKNEGHWYIDRVETIRTLQSQ